MFNIPFFLFNVCPVRQPGPLFWSSEAPLLYRTADLGECPQASNRRVVYLSIVALAVLLAAFPVLQIEACFADNVYVSSQSVDVPPIEGGLSAIAAVPNISRIFKLRMRSEPMIPAIHSNTFIPSW